MALEERGTRIELRAVVTSDARSDDRPLADRHIASVKAIGRGTWREVADRLAELYASRWRMTKTR